MRWPPWGGGGRAQIEVPDNARLVRNLIAGAQLVQDHVVHFYHLQALDWVDVASAIKADPAKTRKLPAPYPNGPNPEWNISGPFRQRCGLWWRAAN